MKHFWAIFAMFFVLAFTTTPVEAKKFGGSRSFGKTHQTQAQQPAVAPNTMQQQQMAPGQAAAGAAAGAAKKGLMGGLLGGLLAGGLFAALLGSGAFEGLQIMDILIMALIAFVIFKLLRSRRPAVQSPTPAYAGSGMGAPNADQRRTFDLGNPGGTAAPGSVAAGFNTSSVPFNLPAGFDLNGFLAGARDHYRTLQEAWNKNDLAKIQEYVSPELYNELKAERATLTGDQHTDVMFVDAELVRADQVGQRAEVSVRFSGRYRDTVEGVEAPITDVWHLERDLSQPGAPWYIVGIEA